MPVAGIKIRSIEANRSGDPGKQINIDQEPNIKKLEKRELTMVGQEGIDMEFEYTYTYTNTDAGKEIAKITFGGNVVFLPGEDQDAEEIEKRWNDEEKIDKTVFIPSINRVIRHCTTRMVGLAEDLGVPPPVRFPSVSAQSQNSVDASRYIG